MAARRDFTDHEQFRWQLKRNAGQEQAAQYRDGRRVAKGRYLSEAARRTEEGDRVRADLGTLLQRSLVAGPGAAPEASAGTRRIRARSALR